VPLHPTWIAIAVRLGLTVIASGLIGLDREARRQPAGLRTLILVGVAAAIAMIQANLLLPVDGKTSSSFSVLDLMRLPLGILTGVGFIGGGAILKRGDMVSGVTTAATLWLTTVVGLCFGGGQLGLGTAGTVLALVSLFSLRRIEHRWMRINRAKVVIRAGNDVGLKILPSALDSKGCQATLQEQQEDPHEHHRRLSYELLWRRRGHSDPPVDLLEFLNAQFDVVSFELVNERTE
jgi:putative Mg2+ transporter-C (MgtC) family protein